MKSLLIYPMAFYMFYIVCILLIMFKTRVRSLKSGEMELRYFRAYSGSTVPEYVGIVGRHYDNQFQVPQLFFITCLSYLVVGDIDLLTAVLAWVFIATRIAHTFVHLGKNRVQKRMLTFMGGWIVLIAMWVLLVLKVS